MDSPESKSEGSLEAILPELLTRLVGVPDREVFEHSRQAIVPLSRLCDHISAHREKLLKSKEELRTVLPGLYVSFDEGFPLETMWEVHTNLSDLVVKCIDTYLSLEREYRIRIGGRLDDEEFRLPSGDLESLTQARSTINAAKSVPVLLSKAVKPLTAFVMMPEILETTSSRIATLNKYLTKRFIKSVDDQPTRPSQLIQFIKDPDGNLADYTRIKLIDENPVLTDTLLHIVDGVTPRYRERVERKPNGKRKVVREVEEYRVESAAEQLIEISHPAIMQALESPESFFRRIGGAMQDFYAVLKGAIPSYMEIFELPFLEARFADGRQIKDKLTPENIKRSERGIRKIEKAYLEAIVQKEEDYIGQNKREIDHFRLRESLLTSLYESMKRIARARTDKSKERIARQTIVESMDLKVKIDELVSSATKRRLRRNMREDNEFYTGRQGKIGMFYFEREATPEVKMEEVIGASFDKAKKHLSEIIETGMFPHVMKLSAPGRKVKSNILLIGPYGCGKTELARAICADRRVIGATVNVTDTQTAYMHESVNNVRRVYDAAKDLYMEGREQKPVALILDEFNSWFARSNLGNISDIDAQQVETTFLEILDGMRDYDGILTIAMTNQPVEIPKGIVRRFRYVDVVGQLTTEERADMLKMYLEKSLPVQDITQKHYTEWANRLEDAPGDVVRKVVDETHFMLVPEYIKQNPRSATRVQRTLQRREVKEGYSKDRDIAYLKHNLARFRSVTPDDVSKALDEILAQPPIKMQIETARNVYKEAEELLSEISKGGKRGFGLSSKLEYFESP